jgi:predicted acyl esterase
VRLGLVIAAAAAICAIGCGEDEDVVSGNGGSGGQIWTASFSVRESVEQLHVTHAKPGIELELLDPSGALIQTGIADALGSYVFRKLPPDSGYIVRTQEPAERAGRFTVMSIDGSTPEPSFYTSQTLTPGVGYITTRDGTKLAIYVTLPGPIEQGPYPTVVNYSGYDPAKPGEKLGNYDAFCDDLPALCDAPADPSALIAAVMGYATVGVNMRGTGCSGGAYDFFEPLQLLDGYDVIETVAAQPWVKHGHVGMTGLSYPGITQMFVARMRPPHLAAITPLSVVGNTFTTLVPGGILNDGFALDWGQNVLDKADPYGQGWEQARVDAGDTTCEENQLLHGQKVDITEKALSNPYYSTDVGDPLNPTLFVGEISVPVFLAGSWQDEQTGPFFFPLLSAFSSSPLTRFTVYNGVHPDGFAPQVLSEWKAFLDLHVALQVPTIPELVRGLAPFLFQEIFKASIEVPPDRFAGYSSFEDALAAYQAEPSLRVIFENGAGDPTLGAPVGTFELPFDSYPPSQTKPWRLYLQPNGALAEAEPATATGSVSFQHDPEAGQRGILAPGGDVWDPLPNYAWTPPAPGKAVVFESTPMTADVVMIGSASADLWISSNVEDADLEINLIEVRPDGQEMFVQSGWLRTSQRKLAPTASELWPAHTHLEGDVAPLSPGEWVLARVGIAGFSHVFRAGSRIRLMVDTPGDSRAEWRFRLKEYATAAVHSVGVSSEHPSSVVFPVIENASAPSALPPCPSLRGQPCRAWAAYQNVSP